MRERERPEVQMLVEVHYRGLPRNKGGDLPRVARGKADRHVRQAEGFDYVVVVGAMEPADEAARFFKIERLPN